MTRFASVIENLAEENKELKPIKPKRKSLKEVQEIIDKEFSKVSNEKRAASQKNAWIYNIPNNFIARVDPITREFIEELQVQDPSNHHPKGNNNLFTKKADIVEKLKRLGIALGSGAAGAGIAGGVSALRGQPNYQIANNSESGLSAGIGAGLGGLAASHMSEEEDPLTRAGHIAGGAGIGALGGYGVDRVIAGLLGESNKPGDWEEKKKKVASVVSQGVTTDSHVRSSNRAGIKQAATDNSPSRFPSRAGMDGSTMNGNSLDSQGRYPPVAGIHNSAMYDEGQNLYFSMKTAENAGKTPANCRQHFKNPGFQPTVRKRTSENPAFYQAKRSSVPYGGLINSPKVPILNQPQVQAPTPVQPQGQAPGQIVAPAPSPSSQVSQSRQARGYGNTPIKQQSKQVGAVGRPPVGVKRV